MAEPSEPARLPGARSDEFRRPSVIVDVVGLGRYSPTERSDNWLQALRDIARGGVAPPEPLGRRLRPAPERASIDREDLAAVHHELAAHHHLVDRGAVLGVDELIDDVVERREIDVHRIQEDDVREVADLEPAQSARETQEVRTAL